MNSKKIQESMQRRKYLRSEINEIRSALNNFKAQTAVSGEQLGRDMGRFERTLGDDGPFTEFERASAKKDLESSLGEEESKKSTKYGRL